MGFADHGLGKSLSDVFARTPRKDGGKGFLEIDLSAIVPPRENPRKHFEPQALQELADSIALHGILQPILVTRREGGYEIVAGERRYRAAKMAGLAKVPVVVREEADARTLAELRLIENVQRADLNPIELAQSYKAILDTHGITQEALAARLGKDRSSISNALRLLALPAPLQDEVVTGALSMGHAKALLGSENPDWQLQLARRVLDEGLSVRETERLAKQGPPAGAAPAAAPGKPVRPAHLRELEENLYRLLGTRVKLRERSKGKGALTAYFDNQQQFDRLVAVLERVIKQVNQQGG